MKHTIRLLLVATLTTGMAGSYQKTVAETPIADKAAKTALKDFNLPSNPIRALLEFVDYADVRQTGLKEFIGQKVTNLYNAYTSAIELKNLPTREGDMRKLTNIKNAYTGVDEKGVSWITESEARSVIADIKSYLNQINPDPEDKKLENPRFEKLKAQSDQQMAHYTLSGNQIHDWTVLSNLVVGGEARDIFANKEDFHNYLATYSLVNTWAVTNGNRHSHDSGTRRTQH